MNYEERRLLTDFLEPLQQVRGMPKDPEAEALIMGMTAKQPDALYLLVQKALLQDRALHAARTQIAELQQQLAQARSQQVAPTRNGSFLGNDPWATPVRSAPIQTAPSASWNPAPSTSWMSGSTPGVSGSNSGFGSFLGTAAATAAGVAGGAFLFQGIEHLLGGNDESKTGFLGTGGDQSSPDHVENITINEYFGSNSDSDRHGNTHDANFSPSEEDFSSYEDDDTTYSV